MDGPARLEPGGELKSSAVSPLRILHIIPSLSQAHGGPSFALPAMARSLSAAGAQVDVACTDDDGPGRRMADVPLGIPVQMDGFRIFYFRKQTEFYKASLPLLAWLRRHVAEYDAVHAHAVFSFSTVAAGWACRWQHVPLIVRPLGVLASWGMANRRRRLKALSFRCLDKPLLDHAAALHYTSEQERDDASRLGLRPRTAVIPLGFDLAPFDSLPPPSVFFEKFPQARGREVILFLSRLDPKKNIESLLEALAILPGGSVLIIAGDGEAEYVEQLHERSRKLSVTGRVIWAGHLDGDLKLSALSAASIYALPSHSENFGIALLEAMAAGLPCVSTPGVALAAEAAEKKAVLLSQPDPNHLADAIGGLLADPDRRRALGGLARSLARERYSAQSMAASLMRLYETCIVHHHESPPHP